MGHPLPAKFNRPAAGADSTSRQQRMAKCQFGSHTQKT